MRYQLKIGLKLHSTDIDLIEDPEKLHREAVFDYVELYVIPYSYKNKQTINDWIDAGI